MASVVETIRQKKEERGITLAELSRRSGVDYESLRTSMEGRRNLRATEFVCLCKELRLDIGDFTDA